MRFAIIASFTCAWTAWWRRQPKGQTKEEMHCFLLHEADVCKIDQNRASECIKYGMFGSWSFHQPPSPTDFSSIQSGSGGNATRLGGPFQWGWGSAERGCWCLWCLSLCWCFIIVMVYIRPHFWGPAPWKNHSRSPQAPLRTSSRFAEPAGFAEPILTPLRTVLRLEEQLLGSKNFLEPKAGA